MNEFNLWPDKFLTKLVDTVSEKGIGAIFPIWHHRRKSHAEAISKGDEMRLLAQATRDAEAISKGELVVKDGTLLQLVAPNSQSNGPGKRRIEPTIDVAKLATLAAQIDLGDRLRREINVTRALVHAARVAQDDPEAPSQKPVDDDWLHRWHECAGVVSHERLQELWGRVLAGEVKSPGAYSLRTLDFIKNLSTDEAALIREFSAYVPKGLGALWLKHRHLRRGIKIEQAMALQSLGLISAVPDGLQRSYQIEKGVPTIYEFGKRGIVVTPEKGSTFIMQVFPLSKTMQELLTLCDVMPDEENLEIQARSIAQHGLEVFLADLDRAKDGTLKIENPIRVSGK